MRDWITIMEAITDWTVDPNFDNNEAEMMSKFHGYGREMRHYSQKEKRLIRDTQHVERISNALAKSPVPFSMYFWQSNDPNYDLTAFKGQVEESWLRLRLGDDATDAIMAQTSNDAITIVITNNLSDENKISLESPWILAHRIVHGIVGDNAAEEAGRITSLMNNFIYQIMTVGYGVAWNQEDGFDFGMGREYLEIYGKLLGEALGTMKSARTKRLTSVYEWFYETVTQFLIRGNIRFNRLPEEIDEDTVLVMDHRRAVALKAWGNLPARLERTITTLMNTSRGKIFVV